MPVRFTYTEGLSEQPSIVVQSDGKIPYCSVPVALLFGYTPNEIEHIPFSDLIPERYRAGNKELMSLATKARLKTPFTRPFAGLHADGSEFYAELTVEQIIATPSESYVFTIQDRNTFGALKKLEESESRYQELLGATTDYIQSIDSDGVLQYTNQRWREALGYCEDDCNDKHIGEIIAPEYHAYCAQVFQKVLDGKSLRNIEVEFLRANGSRIFVEGNIIPRWEGNKIVGSHGFFRDVTESHAYQHKLEKLNEKLSSKLETVNAEITRRAAALEASMEGVALLDKEGCYTYLNKAHLRLLGYTDEKELLGKSWRLLYRQPEINRFETEVFPALEERMEWSGEATALKKDGTEIEEDVSLKLVPGVGMICTCRDITQRKKDEKELAKKHDELTSAKERQRYAMRFRLMVEAIAGKTTDELCSALSSHLCSQLDVSVAFIARYSSKAENKLKTVAVSSKVNFPSDFEYSAAGTPCGTILETNKISAFEVSEEDFPNIELIKAHGLTHYLGAPIPGERGSAEGIIVVMHNKSILDEPLVTDILKLFTTWVAACWKDQRREDQLRHNQKMEALGQMAGGIAHDFNNLITVVHGNLSLARQTLTEDIELADDMLNDAEQAAIASREITRQLLEFSHRKTIALTPISVQSMLDEFTSMVRPLIGSYQRLNATYSTLVGDTFVCSDKSVLHSVLLNLVKNASDAQPNGGCITLGATINAGEVIISVTDQGVGIASEHLKKIFEPFFTTKGPSRGTGLGLAMSADFIQRCNGRIEAESIEGFGSKFSISLPVTAPPQLIRNPEKELQNMDPTRFWIVDDEPGITRLLERHLKRTGAATMCFSCADTAWIQFQRETKKPDFVISDIDMLGELSGIDLAEKIANDHAQTKMLLITGKSNSLPSDLDIPLLQKPFNPDELSNAIRKIRGRE